MLLRPATPDDAFAIATVHVAAWRETYRGLVPDAMLAGLSVERRAQMWAGAAGNVTVAEADGVVGFAAIGLQRDERLREAGFDGEITAVYLLRAHQRRGIGRRLMAAAAVRLAEHERHGAALWVLSGNAPARSFYAALGGTEIAERTEDRPGVSLHEVAYGWRDLAVLTR